ncbi:MAG: DUF3365 domain-containing protein [Deltaproteobacteria bacterium]|nr:DUF3365 domain-containing protein [Deltaproteobacteria bacterium]
MSLIFLLIIFGILSYLAERERAKKEAFQISEILVDEVEASRAYVRHILRPKMASIVGPGKFVPEMMSASFVARNVFEQFLKKYPDYHIKFASLNPRNLLNQADPIDIRIIKEFQSDSKKIRWQGIVSRKGEDYFTVAKSFPIKKSCLRCHGNPQDAPESLLDKYGPNNAFGLKIGDVTMYSVGVPLKISYQDVWRDALARYWPVLVLFVVFFLMIISFFKNLIEKPAERLVYAINRLADGQLNERIDVDKVGKLKALAESYNEMADRLSNNISTRERAEEELRKQKIHLEEQVEERTIDLLKANKLLQDNILIQKATEQKIKTSLQEKDTLLHEIHHRVKNNMTLISSLLKLQMVNVTSKKAKEALQDSQNRVNSMCMIHETLYRTDDISAISMEKYLSELGRVILQSYSIGNNININVKAEDIMIGIKQASSIGLIVNELITNSLKYAFPDQSSGEINLGLKSDEENIVELCVSDNGIGIPKDSDIQNSNSLGLKLVKAIVENQLDGSFDFNKQNDTKFTIKFNIDPI